MDAKSVVSVVEKGLSLEVGEKRWSARWKSGEAAEAKEDGEEAASHCPRAGSAELNPLWRGARGRKRGAVGSAKLNPKEKGREAKCRSPRAGSTRLNLLWRGGEKPQGERKVAQHEARVVAQK